MSTRFYPRFVRGNPQLRIFLPDWKMILVKPKKPMPDNMVSFKVDPRMTDWDVKNYLEKIYKVKVADIKSTISPGKFKFDGEALNKDYDFKIVDVSLPIGQTFKWPNLFPEDKRKEMMEDAKLIEEELTKDRILDPDIKKRPSWFT